MLFERIKQMFNNNKLNSKLTKYLLVIMHNSDSDRCYTFYSLKSKDRNFVFAEAAIKAMKEKDIFSWFILESKDDVYAEYPYKTIANFFHDAECGKIEHLDWKDPIRLEYFAN